MTYTQGYPYPPQPTPPVPPPRRGRAPSAFRLLPLLLGLILGFLLYRQFFGPGRPAVEPRVVAPRGDLAEDEKATIALFEESSPSVVFITTLQRRRDVFSRRVMEIQEGTGSGFLWDNAGHVVTNFHVIQSLNRRGTLAQVTLWNHRVYDAEVVGVAPKYDLALLRIKPQPGESLRPIPIGASADLKVGQKVFAIGNPFGLDQTLTTGVVSAIGRQIEGIGGRVIEDVIQTDAAINPGNSGGPLLDSAGRLVGVNTAIYSPSGAYAGIGFAVPVDTVNRVIPQLVRSGHVTRPYLGATFHDGMSQEVSRRIGVDGALIISVDADSPAERAGLRGTRVENGGGLVLGDVILEVDGRRISTSDDVYAALERRKAGDTVPIRVFRDGREVDVRVTLDAPRE